MRLAVHPLNDRVVIEPVAQRELTDGGVVIPGTVQAQVQEGYVIAAGPQAKAYVSRKDARVIYSKYSGCEVEINGRWLVIIREREVLARVYAGNHAH